MASSGILHRVALVRTDISEELSASFIRVTRIGELGTTLAVTSSMRPLLITASVVLSSPILDTLTKEALNSYETSVLTGATVCNIPEEAILHSHRREHLKSCKKLIDVQMHIFAISHCTYFSLITSCALQTSKGTWNTRRH
jgi:hypothetical protein